MEQTTVKGNMIMVNNRTILLVLSCMFILSSLTSNISYADEKRIELSSWTSNIQANPNENILYISQHGDLTRGEECSEFLGVSVFDGTTFEVLEHIDIDGVAKYGLIMAFDVEENTLHVRYADDYESPNIFISTIDGKTQKIIETENKGPLTDFEKNTFENFKIYYPVNPNNGNIYLTDVITRTVKVIHDDFDNPEKVIHIADGPNGDVSINPKTNKIYVANSGNISGLGTTVSVIDGNIDEVVDTFKFDKRPFWVHINPDTNILYVISTENIIYAVDANTHDVLKEFDLSSKPNGITVNPTTQVLYVLQGGGISVIDMVENTLLEIKKGGNFSHGCPTAEDKFGSYLGKYLNYDVLFGVILIGIAYFSKRNDICGKIANSKTQWIFAVLPGMWGWALFRIQKVRMGITFFLGFKLIFGMLLTYFWDFPLDVLVYFAITTPVFFYMIKIWTMDWNEQVSNNVNNNQSDDISSNPLG